MNSSAVKSSRALLGCHRGQGQLDKHQSGLSGSECRCLSADSRTAFLPSRKRVCVCSCLRACMRARVCKYASVCVCVCTRVCVCVCVRSVRFALTPPVSTRSCLSQGECGMTEGPHSTKLPQSWDTGSDQSGVPAFRDSECLFGPLGCGAVCASCSFG